MGSIFPKWNVEPVFLFVAERSENTMAEKKPKIESGYRIGHLTVTEATSQRKMDIPYGNACVIVETKFYWTHDIYKEEPCKIVDVSVKEQNAR